MRELVINILTSNRVSELCICLTSLINQSFQEWDLVLIDDGSEQPCTNYKFFNDLIGRLKINHCVKFLRHINPTYNVGANRNEAVKISKTIPNNEAKYCLRIDDDSMCEKDYVEQLYLTFKKLETEGIKVGAVGGVVPLLEGPNYYRKCPLIFNETVFNDGEIVRMEDDGGVDYSEDKLLPSHHLRSSFLFSTEAHDEAGEHPIEYGPTGFREETDFNFRLRMKGYTLWTVTQAKCYHQKARSGGARLHPQMYNQYAMNNEELFRNKMKFLWKRSDIKL